jgi:hypothetical protein
MMTPIPAMGRSKWSEPGFIGAAPALQVAVRRCVAV